MALAPDDIVQVKWRATAQNQEIQFQQTYKVLTAPGAVGTLATLFGIASYYTDDVTFGGPSALTDAWLNMLGTGVQLYKVEAKRLLPTQSIYVQKEAAISGTGGTGPRATNTCAVFTLVAATPGRKNRASFHVGPLADAFMSAGGLSTTALTNLRALGQAAQTVQSMKIVAADDCTLQPVIMHRNPNANPRTIDVASYRINFWVRTQRRRTIQIGK